MLLFVGFSMLMFLDRRVGRLMGFVVFARARQSVRSSGA
jgi:hypothetical protein